MNQKESISSAISALMKVAEEIRRVESEAKEALFLRDEPALYREKLEEKTLLLMEMPDEIEPFLDGMERNARAEVEAAVNNFVRRAMQARELSSTFYMSALLYPDDYKEGEDNDLEKFIDLFSGKYLP